MDSSRTAPLNVLFITADQWRSDLIALARTAGLAFPNLDALAREGTRFENHYSQAYPCGPARASLNTGLYAHKHRSIQNGTPLDSRHRTIFQEARRAGYRPFLFGYTDTTLDPRNLSPSDPDRYTYESVAPGLAVAMQLTERSTPWLAHLKQKGFAIPHPDRGRGGVFAMAPFGAPTIFSAADSEAAFLTDRFLAWIGVQGATPWFVHLSYISPHPPFGVGEPFFSRIANARIETSADSLGANLAPRTHPLVQCSLDHAAIDGFFPTLQGLVRDQPDDIRRKLRAIYAGEALEVDFHIGRIVDALKRSGQWEKTAIVFTSDHGEQLFDHELLGKLAFFDQSAHVPLIIRDPRAGANAGRGSVVTAFSEAVDVMPTILTMLGLDVLRNCDGASLLPFCRGEESAGWRDEVHWSFDFRDMRKDLRALGYDIPAEWCNLQVVRTARLKYIHFAALPPVLFDLAQDPGERVDRAGDPSFATLEREGMARLLTWRQRSEERTLTGVRAEGGDPEAEEAAIL